MKNTQNAMSAVQEATSQRGEAVKNMYETMEQLAAESDLLSENIKKLQAKHGAVPAIDRHDIVHFGSLMKKGTTLRKNWKLRFFILQKNPNRLSYYSSAGSTKPIKSISLTNGQFEAIAHENVGSGKIATQRQFNLFHLVKNNSIILTMQAGSPEIMQEWIHTINQSVGNHSDTSSSVIPSSSSSASTAQHNSLPTPSVDDQSLDEYNPVASARTLYTRSNSKRGSLSRQSSTSSISSIDANDYDNVVSPSMQRKQPASIDHQGYPVIAPTPAVVATET
eukprot:CAMPEP_0201548404 /NCGR_PEP_ID=MMETSP0173_2-20130828/4945_1 /ASSEMBLY_ACC=CAM_ASM_000268 /TAXON_ID=218659 /ORGANISM="Vexillifera sp., Strain DIVA3 564/2" /LENGTH=278 /DNA_ID=CAMNT_0047957777 /DNA_START=14 /DNA_END=846 /DNA_ORIENTATION=-